MKDRVIEIEHALFHAKILKQGAQLIFFQPKGDQPFLWAASLKTFEKGKPFRGGIPVCWPWFGKEASPSHGFARIMEWNLVSQLETPKGATIVFELHDTPQTRDMWPFAFTLNLTLRLSQSIQIDLEVNAAKESTAALHTYLTCKDSKALNVTGLGNTYRDALNHNAVCSCDDLPLTIHEAIDRVYTQPQDIILMREKKSVLSITQENHSDVVVWNPWEEGAKNFSDMNEKDYTKMLCLETARISRPLGLKESLHVRISRDK